MQIEKSSIEFNFLDVEKIPFPENEIREWIFAIISNEEKELGFVNYIFCNDEELLRINIDFLAHDTYTDIITFDYSEDFFNITGDIFISVERVIENAVNFNVRVTDELFRVMCHGVLHLCGYKDKRKTDKEQMRFKEDFYLGILLQNHLKK